MARVFLSYHRSDAARAGPIASALKKAGHSVWWDPHITPGAQYSKEIDQALKGADAVVVLWSERSAESPWVRDEAAAGRDTGRLVPVTLDKAEPPLGFRQYQTIDLSARKLSSRSPALDKLVRAVDGLGGSPAAAREATKPASSDSGPRSISRRALLTALAAVLVIGLAFVAWQRWTGKSATPVVAIAASDQTSASRSLARDLLIRIGGLQAAQSDVFRLVEGDAAGDFDLILEAASRGSGADLEANIALLRGSDQSLLWSTQLVQPSGSEAHLRQQLAVTAGRVLNCALQGLNDKRAGVTPDVLKLYLNGCASFDELAYGELRRMIPVMREVTRKAPEFEGAWGKLIQAEVLTAVAGAGDPGLVPQLRKDIAEARRVNPHLAEAYLADVELLPPQAYAERLRLTHLATDHNPSHPEPFAARAYYLRFVGRMADSVESAKRGAELNPLSPALHIDYINALAAAGEFGAAKQELARAEHLWPGSSVVAAARFGFHVRYGDPHLAVAHDQPRSSLWTPRVAEAFRQARITPTPAHIDRALGEARAVTRQEPAAIVVLVQVLGAFDRNDELIGLLLDPKITVDPQISEVLFRPPLREARRDPRFMRVAKRLRLLDYWRQSGEWPDFCFEPDLPYDCKKEAAKLTA